MLKTVTAFLIADKATKKLLSPESLQEVIPSPTIADPDKTQWQRTGFTKPDYFGEETVFVGADNSRVFCVQIRDRVLPGAVIKSELKKAIAEAERRQGHKCGRKQIAQMKDEIVVQLLPHSHIKPMDVLCMITNDYLLIGSGSARVVDLVLLDLFTAFPEQTLLLKPLPTGRQVGKWMLELLLAGTTDDGEFNIGDSVVLRGESKATARFKDLDLHSDRIHAHVQAGMMPIEMSVEYSDRLEFRLSDQLVIKGLKFSSLLIKSAQEEADSDDTLGQFSATVALVGGELRSVLGHMVSEMPEKSDEDEDDEL